MECRKLIMKGFTLIEIFVVVSIILLITGMAFMQYRSFGEKMDLTTTADEIIATLHLAKDQTIASENDQNFGVHFESDRFVLFQSDTYNPVAVANEMHTLQQSVEIFSINLVSGNDIVFERISGKCENYGTIGVRLKNNPSRTQTITVLPSGQAGLSENIEKEGSRITDSRHVHFNLIGSIQDASTLTLFFEDPSGNITENVLMLDYFNPTKSEFYWENSIDVNGELQTLSVHTHLLNSTDTLLCIHRDRHYNTKPVTISIDGNVIVRYDSNDTPNPGVFTESLEIQ